MVLYRYEKLNIMGPLSTYLNYLQQTNQQLPEGIPQQPVVVQPDQSQQQQMPQVDTSNAIQSLAQLMGPTPAEREAQERKLLENKRKMIAWTGLFDGLRQLGNLYYATKGATPQQYTDKPYQAIEQNYQQERQLQDYANRYSQAYAKQLFDWQQKMSDTERRNKIAEAQAKYYDTRDEMAKQKAELDKMKAVRVIKQKDGSLMKFDPVSGSIEPLSEADPLYVEYMNSRINATNKRAGLIGAPVTTTTTDAKGNTRTSVKTYGNSGGSSKGKSSGNTKGKGKTIKGYTKSGNGSETVTRKGKAYGK